MIGPWLPRGAVEPAKGYSVTFAGSSRSTDIPTRLGEAKVIVTPVRGGLRLTGKLDLVGLRSEIDSHRIASISRVASSYLSLELRGPPPRMWAGLRPLSPDGLPVIGRHPSIDNLVLATGHGMLGIALAPLTGRLVDQIVNDTPTDLDLYQLRPERFSRRRRRGV